MRRGALWLLALSVLALAACPGESTVTRRKDTGTTPSYQDGGKPWVSPDARLKDGPTTKPVDGAPLPTGSASCTEIFLCIGKAACKDGDDACYRACIDKGTAQAQKDFDAVNQCDESAIKGTCATACVNQASQACAACLDGACTTPYAACGLVYSCSQIYACFGKCPANDLACYGVCTSKGTDVGAYQYGALEACLDAAVKGACKSSCADTSSQACATCCRPYCTQQAKDCGLI